LVEKLDFALYRNMRVTYTAEPLKTAASVLKDKEASIKHWANAMLNDALRKDPAFIAYCELGSYGPANDWNGKRSVANELTREINFGVLYPAQDLLRELRKSK
jgi:hypothetical protein